MRGKGGRRKENVSLLASWLLKRVSWFQAPGQARSLGKATNWALDTKV